MGSCGVLGLHVPARGVGPAGQLQRRLVFRVPLPVVLHPVPPARLADPKVPRHIGDLMGGLDDHPGCPQAGQSQQNAGRSGYQGSEHAWTKAAGPEGGAGNTLGAGTPRSARNFAAYSPGPAAAARSEPDTAGQTATRAGPGPGPGAPLVRGCFRWWWQVLGSNQRRLSRRFYRPFVADHRNGR
jgi:hypothetical protein